MDINMNYVQLYEDLKFLNEIGDGSSKPFKWKTIKPYKSYFEEILKHAEDTYKSGMAYIEVDPFWYTLESEQALYRAQMQCWLKKKMPRLLMRKLNSPTSKPPAEKDYRKWAIETEFHFNLAGEAEEGETNLNEQFRLMATLTECVLDFIKNAKDYVDIREVNINAKADDTPDMAKLDSRRGRLYLAYVKNNIRKLPGSWTADMDREGITIMRGKITTNDPDKNYIYNI